MLLNTRLLARIALAVIFAVPLLLIAAAGHSQTLAADAPLSGILTLFVGNAWIVYVLIAGLLVPWLAAFLPQVPPSSPWAPLRALLDLAAANIGNAANKALTSPGMAASVAQPGAQLALGIEHVLLGYHFGAGTPVPPAIAAAVGNPSLAALPAQPPAAAPAAPAGVPQPAAGAIAAMLGAFALCGVLVLGACSPQQTAALKVACQVDAAAQPIAVPLASALVPQVAGIASIDQQLVHPAVIAACAAVNGKPVAAP